MENIELYKKPLEIKNNLPFFGNAEMTEWQSGFLCGLIKKYSPKKIVEVGVAAGGTTTIILNCIAILGLDSIVYSVDVNKMHYRDTGKETGYLAEQYKHHRKDSIHKTYYGGILAEYLDEIGDEIDFVVLDTVHSMPGEILDFLTVLPKLKNGAIVVLHDIILNHLYPERNESFATKVLLSSVVGMKILGKEYGNPADYPGIGAFRVTPDTRKYIENVFLSLTISWVYMPKTEQLNLYKEYFRQHYSRELCEEFDAAVELNRKSSNIRQVNLSKGFSLLVNLAESLKGTDSVFVYGCGYYGKRIYNVLKYWKEIKMEGYVISDDQILPPIQEKVEYISNVENQGHTFIIGTSIEIQNIIRKKKIKGNCIYLDSEILKILKYLPLQEQGYK